MNISSVSVRLDFYVLKDDVSGTEFYSDQGSDSVLSYHHCSPSLKVNGEIIPARMLDMDVANVIKMLFLTIDAVQCTSGMALLQMERVRIARSRCVDVLERILSNDEYKKFDARNPVYFSNRYMVRFNTSRGFVAVTDGKLFISDGRVVVTAGNDCFVMGLAHSKVTGYFADGLKETDPYLERIPLKIDIDVVAETVIDVEQIFRKAIG